MTDVVDEMKYGARRLLRWACQACKADDQWIDIPAVCDYDAAGDSNHAAAGASYRCVLPVYVHLYSAVAHVYS